MSSWLSKILPSIKQILNEVVEETDIRKKLHSGKISVSEAFIRLEKLCHKKYREYERKARIYGRKIGKKPEEIEMSLFQSRATRGGGTVEIILSFLLEQLKIPHKRKVKLNGEEVDILIPDKETLKTRPSDAIILSVKRKVRERWREVVGEAYILRRIHKIPDNIWFVCLDEEISPYVIKTMRKLNIRIYVPDKLFTTFKNYGVRKISKLVDDVIDIIGEQGLKKFLKAEKM